MTRTQFALRVAFILQTEYGLQPLDRELEWFEAVCFDGMAESKEPADVALDLRLSDTQWKQVPSAEDFVNFCAEATMEEDPNADTDPDGHVVNLTRYKFNAHWQVLEEFATCFGINISRSTESIGDAIKRRY